MESENNNSLPKYKDIAKAVSYWVILNDLSNFFKEAGMPTVNDHLDKACAEIDRLWTEYEYSNKENEG